MLADAVVGVLACPAVQLAMSGSSFDLIIQMTGRGPMPDGGEIDMNDRLRDIKQAVACVKQNRAALGAALLIRDPPLPLT